MFHARCVSLGSALTLLTVALICGPIRAATAPPPPPKGGSGKPTDKTTVQPKSGGGGLDQKTIDEQAKQIQAAEGDTAGAIRGITAASQPSSPTTGPQLKAIELKGRISTDSENAKNDTDPPFIPQTIAAAVDAAALVTAPGQVRLSEIPNAKDIATKASNFLSQKEIKIALLGQHKYMINDCLGVKVSVGEFNLKLANPTVSIVDEGIVTQFKIDKISMTAFSLRFRPNPGDLAEPCHFSGRVGMFGEANDVSVTLTYNPLIDKEKCQIGNPATWVVKVGCGKVALQPLPPAITDLDGPFKDMMVDAINYCLNGSTQVGGATGNSIPIPMIGSMMADAINKAIAENCPFKDGNAAGAGAGASGGASAHVGGGTGDTGPMTTTSKAGGDAVKAFTVQRIPNARGRLGHLNLKMPAGSKDSKYVICKAGDKDRKALKEGYGGADETLIPGKYDLYISNKLVPAVEVQPISETTVAIGAVKLNLGKDTRYTILDADGKTSLHSAYGAAVVALPAGNYFVEVSGSSAPVEVKANEVTEF